MRAAILASCCASCAGLAALLLACSSDPGTMSGYNPGNGQMTTSGGVDFPATGNQYVDQRRCPACHQSASPQTDGFMSGAHDPIQNADYPANVQLYGPNLTPDVMTGIGGWTDDQITNAIRNGVDNQGERLCPQMQHFADMGDDELTSILGYLHSLKPVSHQPPTSKCPPLKY
jgi:hypothetical protein